MVGSTGGPVVRISSVERAAAWAGAAVLLGCVACVFLSLPAAAKTPGTRYCFGGWCHRVGTLAQTETLVGWRGYLVASYYDDCHRDRLNPCGLTSSGAVFRADQPDNAASPLFPDGTIILAYNPKTGDASVLRITSAGPYSGERKLDVSRAGADRLGFKAAGTARLVVSVLKAPTKAEATYVKRRIYPRVPGPLGKFENFDAAYAAAMQKIDAEATGTPIAPAVGALHEASDEQAGLVEPPRPAVSPYFARELMMLRVPPRPVTRVRLSEERQGDESGDEEQGTDPAELPPSRAADSASLDGFDFGYRLRTFDDASAPGDR